MPMPLGPPWALGLATRQRRSYGRTSWDPGGPWAQYVPRKTPSENLDIIVVKRLILTCLEVQRASSLEKIRLNKPDELKVPKPIKG